MGKVSYPDLNGVEFGVGWYVVWKGEEDFLLSKVENGKVWDSLDGDDREYPGLQATLDDILRRSNEATAKERAEHGD